jgi:hypothetical protein
LRTEALEMGDVHPAPDGAPGVHGPDDAAADHDDPIRHSSTKVAE